MQQGARGERAGGVEGVDAGADALEARVLRLAHPTQDAALAPGEVGVVHLPSPAQVAEGAEEVAGEDLFDAGR